MPKQDTAHGGHIRVGRRKVARTIVASCPMHLVFRASGARGERSFLHKRHKGVIHLILLDLVERYGIKLYRYENVGNHLHLLIKGRSREEIRSFLRVFPQRIMFLITGAKKGNPQGRFFDSIVYSRVVSWGREFKIIKDYLWKNAMEALGFSRSKSNMWLDPIESG